jgi:hypothetical protein
MSRTDFIFNVMVVIGILTTMCFGVFRQTTNADDYEARCQTTLTLMLSSIAYKFFVADMVRIHSAHHCALCCIHVNWLCYRYISLLPQCYPSIRITLPRLVIITRNLCRSTNRSGFTANVPQVPKVSYLTVLDVYIYAGLLTCAFIFALNTLTICYPTDDGNCDSEDEIENFGWMALVAFWCCANVFAFATAGW